MKDFQEMFEEDVFKEAEHLLARTFAKYRITSFNSEEIIAEAMKREEDNLYNQKLERILAKSEVELAAWDALRGSLNDAFHGKPEVLPPYVRDWIASVENRIVELNEWDVYGLNTASEADVALSVGEIEDALFTVFSDYAGLKRNSIAPIDIEYDAKVERIKTMVARVRLAINQILADFYPYLEIRFRLTPPGLRPDLVEAVQKTNVDSKFDDRLSRLALVEIPHLQRIASALENKHEDISATRITIVRNREAERHLPDTPNHAESVITIKKLSLTLGSSS